jgi:hypothetical protein
MYLMERFSGTTASTSKWTPDMLRSLIDRHNQSLPVGGYALFEQLLIRDAAVKYSIRGATAAVIGSMAPWLEAILFCHGAAHVTTIEYGTINSTIPNHIAFTPRDFARAYLREPIQFDMVASMSSLEHSGLGRYGDALNPRGDIDASEEVYCMLKPGGYFLISMPYVPHSRLVWNAHRQYGPERMKLFAAGYRQVDLVGTLWKDQGTFVLQKPESIG